MLPSQDYFTTKDQLQQQSLAHQQQLLQLQQQLDTERRMRRSMALQLDKLQESSDNISTGNILKQMFSILCIGDIGTKEVTMTDIAIQCTTHDNTSGNVITVQSIILCIIIITFIIYSYMYMYTRHYQHVCTNVIL